jgi:hypothetical protein
MVLLLLHLSLLLLAAAEAGDAADRSHKAKNLINEGARLKLRER